jgi:hypothetical protein
MARRQLKRTDLAPYSMGPNSDPSDDPSFDRLKLEIAIRSGALRKYPFPSEVRGDLAVLLNVSISEATWYKIKATTARYILRASSFHAGLSSVTVRRICKELVGAIDRLKQIYDRNAADPRIDTLMQETCVDISVKHLADFDRTTLMREIKKSTDGARIASGPGWDQWIRDLAGICSEIGIAPSGEGPDRNFENQSSRFVRLIRRLQAELPEICVEHEPNSRSSEASFARAIRRALSMSTVPRANAN